MAGKEFVGFLFVGFPRGQPMSVARTDWDGAAARLPGQRQAARGAAAVLGVDADRIEDEATGPARVASGVPAVMPPRLAVGCSGKT
jgi:hypothetical protein